MDEGYKEYKKNDSIELTVKDIGSGGEGIGKTGAFTWFVKDALPGDRIAARVMKVKKNYGYARLEKILIPGNNRINCECPVARTCGGCSLQAMNYEAQLEFKEKKVQNDLIRIGGFGEKTQDLHQYETGKSQRTVLRSDIEWQGITGMDNPWRYRNKAQFPIGKGRDGKIKVGFYAGRTHSIIECGDCLIGIRENKNILDIVLDFMEKYHIDPYDEKSHTGLIRHVLIRKGFATGEIMCCIIINGSSIPHSDELAKSLMEFPGMKTIVININTDRSNAILGEKTVIIAGTGYISDFIGEVKFHISAKSFYQVNPLQTGILYKTALDFAGLTGTETVWDLYCGIGSISLFLAKRAGQVYGVEVVREAVEDAKENAKINGIKNASFYLGKAEEILPAVCSEKGGPDKETTEHRTHPDVIVVDPPRKGCDSACLEIMLQMQPERIVYVSCDSATLARDLKILCEKDYTLKKVSVIDQFPHTIHTETAALLSRRDTESKKKKGRLICDT